MNRTFTRFAAPLFLSALTAITLPLPAHAADNEPVAATARGDKLAPARALIAENRWRDAIAALQQVNDTRNADWNNLMGYSHRKAKTPDFAAAERYYDAALRIDPNHRGALEYSGELFLMLNDLPRAEARLTTLDKVCGAGCEEFKDLKDAIARYKSNGNRYVLAP